MELTIEKLIYGGDGLARLPADEHGAGKAVFVPFVLQGETVAASLIEQKKGFARARLDSIPVPSSARIDPLCPYFKSCGGCQYQHTDYQNQLNIKLAILKENLRRIAKVELEEIQVHPSPPWDYRNRTRLKVRSSPDFAVGYFKFNSHELLPVKECPISSPLINRAITTLWEMRHAKGVEEIEFFANAEDTQLLVEVYGSADVGEFRQELQACLPEALGIAAFPPAGRSVLNPVDAATLPVRGNPKPASSRSAGEDFRPPLSIAYSTRDSAYRVSAGAFFQVNRHLIDELVTSVTAGQSGRTALDLYAGVGLFSTVLSREFERVVAVEASPISHGDLRYNSPANVKAVRSMSEQYLKNVSCKLQPDLVVVDPPRSGLGDSVIHSLVNLGAPRLTYVSCDPATLSRDLAGLLRAGYRVERTHLVDLFPQTYHLESVLHLVR